MNKFTFHRNPSTSSSSSSSSSTTRRRGRGRDSIREDVLSDSAVSEIGRKEFARRAAELSGSSVSVERGVRGRRDGGGGVGMDSTTTHTPGVGRRE